MPHRQPRRAGGMTSIATTAVSGSSVATGIVTAWNLTGDGRSFAVAPPARACSMTRQAIGACGGSRCVCRITNWALHELG